MKRIVDLFKAAITDFGKDEAPVLAAALAFYTVLSLAPVLLLLVSVAALLGPETQRYLLSAIGETVGPQAADTIAVVIGGAAMRHTGGVVGTLVATVTMLLGASGVVAHLQYCLNRIWNVEAKTGGIWPLVRKRLVSLGLFLVIAAIVAVSLLVGTILSSLVGPSGIGLQVLDTLIFPVVVAALMTIVYKYLPDVGTGWREAWFGGLVTAALFTIGKFGIGLYLRHASVASAYGAAGSLIIILLWIYYGSLIVFLGAELTQVHARTYGQELRPERGTRPLASAPAHTP